MPGVCAAGLNECVTGTTLKCKPTVTSSAEMCDGLDNDCDGMVDDGATCPAQPGLRPRRLPAPVRHVGVPVRPRRHLRERPLHRGLVRRQDVRRRQDLQGRRVRGPVRRRDVPQEPGVPRRPLRRSLRGRDVRRRPRLRGRRVRALVQVRGLRDGQGVRRERRLRRGGLLEQDVRRERGLRGRQLRRQVRRRRVPARPDVHRRRVRRHPQARRRRLHAELRLGLPTTGAGGSGFTGAGGSSGHHGQRRHQRRPKISPSSGCRCDAIPTPAGAGWAALLACAALFARRRPRA